VWTAKSLDVLFSLTLQQSILEIFLTFKIFVLLSFFVDTDCLYHYTKLWVLSRLMLLCHTELSRFQFYQLEKVYWEKSVLYTSEQIESVNIFCAFQTSILNRQSSHYLGEHPAGQPRDFCEHPIFCFPTSLWCTGKKILLCRCKHPSAMSTCDVLQCSWHLTKTLDLIAHKLFFSTLRRTVQSDSVAKIIWQIWSNQRWHSGVVVSRFPLRLWAFSRYTSIFSQVKNKLIIALWWTLQCVFQFLPNNSLDNL